MGHQSGLASSAIAELLKNSPVIKAVANVSMVFMFVIYSLYEWRCVVRGQGQVKCDALTKIFNNFRPINSLIKQFYSIAQSILIYINIALRSAEVFVSG